MLAKDLQAFFRSLNGGWMDLENTVGSTEKRSRTGRLARIC